MAFFRVAEFLRHGPLVEKIPLNSAIFEEGIHKQECIIIQLAPILKARVPLSFLNLRRKHAWRVLDPVQSVADSIFAKNEKTGSDKNNMRLALGRGKDRDFRGKMTLIPALSKDTFCLRFIAKCLTKEVSEEAFLNSKTLVFRKRERENAAKRQRKNE